MSVIHPFYGALQYSDGHYHILKIREVFTGSWKFTSICGCFPYLPLGYRISSLFVIHNLFQQYAGVLKCSLAIGTSGNIIWLYMHGIFTSIITHVTFCLIDILSHRNFVMPTFCHVDILSYRHFVCRYFVPQPTPGKNIESWAFLFPIP